MKKEAKIENQLKQHFRLLMHVWEFDRKCKLTASKKITEEERSHVTDFLFWLQGQRCRIQEPDHFEAKRDYDAYCWEQTKRRGENFSKKGKQ